MVEFLWVYSILDCSRIPLTITSPLLLSLRPTGLLQSHFTGGKTPGRSGKTGSVRTGSRPRQAVDAEECLSTSPSLRRDSFTSGTSSSPSRFPNSASVTRLFVYQSQAMYLILSPLRVGFCTFRMLDRDFSCGTHTNSVRPDRFRTASCVFSLDFRCR